MIETKRLVLRPWSEADREPFTRMICDPEVGAWLGGARTPDQAAVEFERMQSFWTERGYGWLAMERTSDRAFVGRVVCRYLPAEWRHPKGEGPEIGWALAREAWGNGYASEAAAAVLDWGFGALATPVIYSWTAAGNRRSEAVMRRIGMTRAPELDFEHPDLAANDPLRPHIVYAARRA